MPFSRTALTFLLLASSLALPCHAETVMLDFSSSSCGPCRQMRPIVHQLAATGYRIRDVNIEREPQLAARFHVTQVPTFIVLVNDREAARLTGTTSYEQLREMMDRCTARATQTPVAPLGQSPDTIATVGSNPQSPPQDLSVPQPGRILAINDPNPPARPAPRAANNPFSQASTRQPVPSNGSAVDQNKLIEATVKVAVRDPDGTSAGTGTMVDARSGEALVLTCGHLFRSSGGKGPITVTIFQVGPSGVQVRTTAPGNLIDYDLDRDLALVSIRTDAPIRIAPIGAAGVALQSGAPVTTVGCNSGQNPTAITSRITMIDRFQGYPNVEVAGAPVEGRSGGGLFNAQGQLIGVCNAADPQANEGLYASLPSIQAKLDSLQLTMVYQSPGGTTGAQATDSSMAAQTATAPNTDFAVRGQDAVPEPPSPVAQVAPAAQPQTVPQTPALSPTERAALQEIQSRGANSEVICIIRPHSPEGRSEVITLQDASPAFVQALSHSAASPLAVGPAPDTSARNY